MKIKVKGEEYDLRITFGGMLRYKQETGKDLQDMKEDMPMDDVNKFLWCNFKACNNAEGKSIEGVTMCDMLDGIDMTMIGELMNGAGMKMTVNETADDGEKKR